MEKIKNQAVNLIGSRPVVDVGGSAGILEAKPNKIMKYIAHITLSAATPAANTDGDMPRALEIAT